MTKQTKPVVLKSKKLIREYGEFKVWRKYRVYMTDGLNAVMALECEKASLSVILGKVADSHMWPDWWVPVAMMIYNRCGRGKTTVDEAIKRFRECVKTGVAP